MTGFLIVAGGDTSLRLVDGDTEHQMPEPDFAEWSSGRWVATCAAPVVPNLLSQDGALQEWLVGFSAEADGVPYRADEKRDGLVLVLRRHYEEGYSWHNPVLLPYAPSSIALLDRSEGLAAWTVLENGWRVEVRPKSREPLIKVADPSTDETWPEIGEASFLTEGWVIERSGSVLTFISRSGITPIPVNQRLPLVGHVCLHRANGGCVIAWDEEGTVWTLHLRVGEHPRRPRRLIGESVPAVGYLAVLGNRLLVHTLHGEVFETLDGDPEMSRLQDPSELPEQRLFEQRFHGLGFDDACFEADGAVASVRLRGVRAGRQFRTDGRLLAVAHHRQHLIRAREDLLNRADETDPARDAEILEDIDSLVPYGASFVEAADRVLDNSGEHRHRLLALQSRANRGELEPAEREELVGLLKGVDELLGRSSARHRGWSRDRTVLVPETPGALVDALLARKLMGKLSTRFPVYGWVAEIPHDRDVESRIDALTRDPSELLRKVEEAGQLVGGSPEQVRRNRPVHFGRFPERVFELWRVWEVLGVQNSKQIGGLAWEAPLTQEVGILSEQEAPLTHVLLVSDSNTACAHLVFAELDLEEWGWFPGQIVRSTRNFEELLEALVRKLEGLDSDPYHLPWWILLNLKTLAP